MNKNYRSFVKKVMTGIFGPRSKAQQHLVIARNMMGLKMETKNQVVVNQKMANPEVENQVVKNQVVENREAENLGMANQEMVNQKMENRTSQKDQIILQPNQRFRRSQLIVNVQCCHWNKDKLKLVFNTNMLKMMVSSTHWVDIVNWTNCQFYQPNYLYFKMGNILPIFSVQENLSWPSGRIWMEMKSLQPHANAIKRADDASGKMKWTKKANVPNGIAEILTENRSKPVWLVTTHFKIFLVHTLLYW